MRFKFDIITDSKFAHELFKKRNPSTAVDNVQYRKVIHAINEYYVNHALETANVVYLPFGLGKFLVKKNPRTTYRADRLHQTIPYNYSASTKSGTKVFHFNEHTNGFAYRYFWFSRSSYIVPFAMWKMVITTWAKDRLRDKLLNPESNYKNMYRICTTMSTNRGIKYMMEKVEKNG